MGDQDSEEGLWRDSHKEAWPGLQEKVRYVAVAKGLLSISIEKPKSAPSGRLVHGSVFRLLCNKTRDRLKSTSTLNGDEKF